MENRYPNDNTTLIDGDQSNEAYPNHGIDGNNAHDPAKGAAVGAVGGAVVGGLAGGPVGAVIGAAAGAVASGAAVAGVDRVDNDNSRAERADVIDTDKAVYVDDRDDDRVESVDQI